MAFPFLLLAALAAPARADSDLSAAFAQASAAAASAAASPAARISSRAKRDETRLPQDEVPADLLALLKGLDKRGVFVSGTPGCQADPVIQVYESGGIPYVALIGGYWPIRDEWAALKNRGGGVRWSGGVSAGGSTERIFKVEDGSPLHYRVHDSWWNRYVGLGLIASAEVSNELDIKDDGSSVWVSQKHVYSTSYEGRRAKECLFRF